MAYRLPSACRKLEFDVSEHLSSAPFLPESEKNEKNKELYVQINELKTHITDYLETSDSDIASDLQALSVATTRLQNKILHLSDRTIQGTKISTLIKDTLEMSASEFSRKSAFSSFCKEKPSSLIRSLSHYCTKKSESTQIHFQAELLPHVKSSIKSEPRTPRDLACEDISSTFSDSDDDFEFPKIIRVSKSAIEQAITESPSPSPKLIVSISKYPLDVLISLKETLYFVNTILGKEPLFIDVATEVIKRYTGLIPQELSERKIDKILLSLKDLADDKEDPLLTLDTLTFQRKLEALKKVSPFFSIPSYTSILIYKWLKEEYGEIPKEVFSIRKTGIELIEAVQRLVA